MSIKGYNTSNGVKKKIIFLLAALSVVLGFLLFAVSVFVPRIFKINNSSESVNNIYPDKGKESTNDIVYVNRNYLLPLEKVKVPIRKEGKTDVNIAAKSVLVIDDATNEIIYERNADKKLPVASLTKLSTAMVILRLADEDADEKVAGKNYNLDRIVTISASAVAQEGISGGLVEGERIKASDLFSIMLIASSNDAAWALAEDAGSILKSGGKVRDFVGRMNDFASEEGMNNTHFSNPTGLDDKDNYSSARDVVKIAQKFLRYYSDSFAVTAMKRADFVSENGEIRHHVENTDKLLGELPGIIGGKTGYTDEAGESLMLVVKNPANSSRIIAIVIGADDRFKEMKKLVNWVWETYEWK